MIRLLRGADRVAVPWKNGGGVTREVAIWPPSAGVDDFDWRVSIAEVRNAGPFSQFVGIDRTLAILQGRLVLTFADHAVELTESGTPFVFPGDVPCSGAPVEGPVIDLNVMVRRGRGGAHVDRVTHTTALAAVKAMLIVASASTDIRLGTQDLTLQRFDAVLIEGPHDDPLSLSGAAFVIQIA